MKKLFTVIALVICSRPEAQLSIGVKAGLNFANVTNTAGINASSRSGYLIGGHIAPRAKKLFGFRSEIMLSRQGYDYKTNTNTGTVNLDYLLLPQLITINPSKRFELHIGGQAAFLLNTGVDSSGGGGNSSLFSYFNRFDYGLVGGLQASPFSGFFLGARFNVSLHDMNKQLPLGSPSPGFVPKAFIKNNVLQLYAGWRL